LNDSELAAAAEIVTHGRCIVTFRKYVPSHSFCFSEIAWSHASDALRDTHNANTDVLMVRLQTCSKHGCPHAGAQQMQTPISKWMERYRQALKARVEDSLDMPKNKPELTTTSHHKHEGTCHLTHFCGQLMGIGPRDQLVEAVFQEIKLFQYSWKKLLGVIS
jgi:hypothetical protein